jgi:uncharacterized membrane protein YgdD (TMEM256/DUF423 family)
VSVAGVKLKLSIFTSAIVGWGAFAATTFVDAVNSSPSATTTAVAKPAMHTLLLFMIVSSLNFVRILFHGLRWVVSGLSQR